MSTGAFVAADAYTSTVAGTEVGHFVPELWTNEIIAAYKINLVLADLVTNMVHGKGRGDTVRIPSPPRSNATQRRTNAVLSNLEVQPIVETSNEVVVTIGEHYEYSVLIEDFVEMQKLPSHRRFYTDDAGYALSRQVDFDLHLLGAVALSAVYNPDSVIAGGDYVGPEVVIGGDGATAFDPAAGNATPLTDAGVRRLIRLMDDDNVPLMYRAFVLPPSEKESLLGIARFTQEAFVGEAGSSNSIRSGLIGDLYGNPVYVSTNCPNVDDTVTAGVSASRACQYLHKDAYVLIMQQMMRAQSQYLQQYLSTLFTADMVYGVNEIRPENHITFMVPTN